MKKITILFLLLYININAFSQPMKVEVDGNVSFDNTGYLISEAGEDFASNIESESTVQVSVTSSNYWDKRNNPNGKWRVNVHKSDIQWDSDLILQISRSGNGYKAKNRKSPNIHDGESYLPVTNTPSYFFRGKSEILYIPINVSVSGFSITMGAREYETNIILTVYDDW